MDSVEAFNDDCDRLTDAATDYVERDRAGDGTIAPFALTLDAANQVARVTIAQSGDVASDPAAMTAAEEIVRSAIANDSSIEGVAIVYDTSMPAKGGTNYPHVLTIRIDHRSGGPVNYFVAYEMRTMAGRGPSLQIVGDIERSDTDAYAFAANGRAT